MANRRNRLQPDNVDRDATNQGPQSAFRLAYEKAMRQQQEMQESSNAGQDESPESSRAPSHIPPSRSSQRTDPPREERELTIGLDFGTSCTKVVVRDLALHTADAVPFPGFAYPQNPYLLPTRTYIDRQGHFSLRPSPAEGRVVDNLKLALMQINLEHINTIEQPTHQSAAHTAAAYLSLVLREVHRWFDEAKGRIYQNIQCVWWLNIGIPCRSYDNRTVCQIFHVVALAAWQLAYHSGPITHALAQQAVSQAWQRITRQPHDAVNDTLIHPERVCVIPEIIAEVTGYARSPLRRDGMYLCVDVGASTLDISTFILHQNQGQDAYEILTAEVKELGVLKLHQWRLHEVARLSEEWLIKVSSKGDGVTPIPKLGAYVLNPEQVQLAKVDGTFQKICALLILRVVSETKRRRNPLAPAWELGLPVFISGGGVQMPLYGEALESAAKMLTQGIIWAGFQRMALPKPSDLEAPGLDAHHYHRLAVAYGLSFSSLDIGRITPPGEIPDIAANLVRLNVTSRYVSKDMV